MSIVWIAQGQGSQRDVIRLAREGLGPGATIIASHGDDREDILSQADIAIREPEPSDRAGQGPGYAGWLLGAARRSGAQAVLACRARRSVVEARPAFEAAGIRLSGGALRTQDLDAAERKDVLTRILEERGVPVPRTVLVSDGAGMRRAVSTMADTGEVCVKPAVGIYGRGFWRLSDGAREIDAFLAPELRVAPAEAFVRAYGSAGVPEPFLVMEWLPGPEFSVDCVCDGGVLVAAASRRKEVSYQVVETDGPQVDLARRVAEILALDGLVNVQLRIGADGRLCVLEANTRPSGGVGFSAAAGVNLPGIWARHATGLPIAVPRLASPVAVRAVETPIRLEDTTRRIARSWDRAA